MGCLCCYLWNTLKNKHKKWIFSKPTPVSLIFISSISTGTALPKLSERWYHKLPPKRVDKQSESADCAGVSQPATFFVWIRGSVVFYIRHCFSYRNRLVPPYLILAKIVKNLQKLSQKTGYWSVPRIVICKTTAEHWGGFWWLHGVTKGDLHQTVGWCMRHRSE